MQCYFALMLLSPILNSFIEKYKHKSIWLVAILVLFEFWFECVMKIDNMGIKQGYSIFHFCLMYLVAAEIRLNRDCLLRVKKVCWILAYLGCSLLIIVQYLLNVSWTFTYSNPVVILSSAALFLPFLYKPFYNKAINWIAGSTFAVYILQVTNPFYSLLVKVDNYTLVNSEYPLYMFISVGVIVLFFMFCIIYDKVREAATRPVFNACMRLYSKFILNEN